MATETQSDAFPRTTRTTPDSLNADRHQTVHPPAVHQTTYVCYVHPDYAAVLLHCLLVSQHHQITASRDQKRVMPAFASIRTYPYTKPREREREKTDSPWCLRRNSATHLLGPAPSSPHPRTRSQPREARPPPPPHLAVELFSGELHLDLRLRLQVRPESHLPSNNKNGAQKKSFSTVVKARHTGPAAAVTSACNLFLLRGALNKK